MKLFCTDQFDLPLPPGHRFPLAKYRLLRERLQQESWTRRDWFQTPPAILESELALAHDGLYIARCLEGQLNDQEMRRIGFPWSPALVERSRRSTGATLAAARSALTAGAAANLAGGTHHAQWSCGEGFCVFNDAAVAARVLLHEGAIRRAVVIDCDVHQGNGTAQILAEDPRVFTFSIHSARNYPLRKFPSDLDIGLPDGIDDAYYLEQLQRAIPQVLSHGPFDLACYLAGADPYHDDRFGRLRLTKHGLAQRDTLVAAACREAQAPLVVVMAGGYARRVEDIVDIHARTLRIVHQMY